MTDDVGQNETRTLKGGETIHLVKDTGTRWRIRFYESCQVVSVDGRILPGCTYLIQDWQERDFATPDEAAEFAQHEIPVRIFPLAVTSNAKANAAEIERVGTDMAAYFLGTLGLRAERIPESRRDKRPDFYVYRNDEKVFICEVKCVMRSRSILKDVNKAKEELKKRGFEIPWGGCSIKVTDSKPKEPLAHPRISSHILKATRQFESINADHKYPRVLLFFNFEGALSVNDLAQLLCKMETVLELPPTFFVATESSRAPVSLNASECGLVKCPDIDLFVWVEVDFRDADEDKQYYSCDPCAFFIWNKESGSFRQLSKCFSEEVWPKRSCRQLYLCTDNEKSSHLCDEPHLRPGATH